jgi:hypothetical protein
MKRLIVLILATCLLSQSLLLSAHAQTNNASTIEQIRANIASLERLERNGIAAGEAALLNREFLTSRRKQLREALKRRETALTEYLLVAGSSLSESEQKAVQASLANVRMELRGLNAAIAGADAAATEDGSAADTRARDAESAPVVASSWEPRAAARSASAEPDPQRGGAAPFPSCLPDPRPDEKNDFIINARTGETRGKRRFGRSDTARIIIVEKNPFRYEYELTTKENTITEPAIGAFFGRFPLFADDLKEKTDSSGPKGPLASCPALDEVNMVESQLAAEDASADANSLRNAYLGQKGAYDKVAQKFKTAQDDLQNPNAVCPGLRDTAEGIRSTLEDYDPDLKALSERAKRFKIRADFLQSEVARLQQGTGIPPACAARLDQLRRLASAYVSTADTFLKGLDTITKGKETFDAAVERINEVLSNDRAFYDVRESGPFSLPTDVEITLKRKDRLDEKASLVQVGNSATINFGGGARFAIAGGVVASPFETITYKRVPAIIDGRSTTIIGAENSSNSRILPILMLHGRLFEMNNKYISGVHLSLGITAKPNDTGTNVEWLIGPSLSFIEERLFLTVGGYAGRRQVLEGNLAPGQELPADFKDDIPINNRLVWKPGFALTYKFK